MSDKAGLYRVREFMDEAKAILAREGDLEVVKAEVGTCLARLSQRDDLTRHAAQIGASDAANATYVLWREPPSLALLIVQFDPGYRSPVHEHGSHWIVGCGYRGEDRWDVYERHDDGSVEGHADLELVDQITITPGVAASMAPPPRAIHSHNNVADVLTQELIFSVAPPLTARDRLIYDVEAHSCYPSWFETSTQLQGAYFPPRFQTTAVDHARP